MRLPRIGAVCLAIFILLSWESIPRAEPDPSAVQATSRHFYFKFHKPDQLYMDRIIGRAEELYEKVTGDIGYRSEEPIGVVMAFTTEEFNQFQQNGAELPQWAVGVAYPELNIMAIRSPRLIAAGSTSNPVETFTHELTHLILGKQFGAHPIPRWLNEGLAMYEAYEWNPSQDLLMGRAVLSGELLSLDQLTRAFGGESFEVQLAYLQSYSLINYLISTYGREGFHAFVLQLARGQSFDEALQKTLNLSAQSLEAGWKRHLKIRFNWIPILTSTTVLWFLITCSFFGIYLVRKRKNRRILQRWRREEQQEEKNNTSGVGS
jgi:hypothetical protein